MGRALVHVDDEHLAGMVAGHDPRKAAELLSGHLHVPHGTRVVSVAHDHARDVLDVVLEGEALPAWHRGQHPTAFGSMRELHELLRQAHEAKAAKGSG